MFLNEDTKYKCVVIFLALWWGILNTAPLWFQLIVSYCIKGLNHYVEKFSYECQSSTWISIPQILGFCFFIRCCTTWALSEMFCCHICATRSSAWLVSLATCFTCLIYHKDFLASPATSFEFSALSLKQQHWVLFFQIKILKVKRKQT